MKNYLGTFRFLTIFIVVIVLGALLGWYYFLNTKNQQTNTQNTGAGYGTAAPTFEGSTGSTYANIVSTLGQTSGFSAASSTSQLWQVSAVPIAGFGWLTSTSSPSLYFVERSSGYVFEAQTAGRAVTDLTDTLRPKIYEASVTQGGSVIERSIDDTGTIITFSGAISTSTSPQSGQPASTSSVADLDGNTLPQNIDVIAADPHSDTLFFTIPGPGGISLVSTNLSGQKEKQLFSSAISGWQLIAPGDGSVTLLQGPLDGVQGYAYRIAKNGSLSSLAQAPGLTVLPHASSSALIFGSSSNGVLSLYGEASAGAAPTLLSVQTVASKCAWSPAALIAYCAVPQSIPSQQFLDDWYKGLVHTSDEFYEVNVSDASTTLVYDPAGQTSAQLDVEDPSVDPSGQYLAFINASDKSLWILRLTQ